MFELCLGDGSLEYGIEKIQSDAGLTRWAGLDVGLPYDGYSHGENRAFKRGLMF
jgi:hypothetical protein